MRHWDIWHRRSSFSAPWYGRRRGFLRKVDAERWANSVEVRKMTGDYVAPSLGRITVAELASDWLQRKEQFTAPSHHRMLESAWRVHVGPRWGKTAVADVDRLSVEAWIASMTAGGAGATTVIRAHGVLSGILTDAPRGWRPTRAKVWKTFRAR